MAVHQCPRCELRFADKAELSSHLVVDHGLDPEDLAGPRSPGPRSSPDLVGGSHDDERS